MLSTPDSDYTRGQAQFIASLSENNAVIRTEVKRGIALAYTLDNIETLEEDSEIDGKDITEIQVDGEHRQWVIGGMGDLLGINVQQFSEDKDDWEWATLPMTSNQLTSIQNSIRA